MKFDALKTRSRGSGPWLLGQKAGGSGTRRYSCQRLLCAAALVVVCTPLLAQEAIVTDRPDFTESTATVPVGSLQLEGGATWTEVEDAEELSLGELLLRLPFGPALEGRLAVGYLTSDGPDGLEDPTVGV